MWVQYKHKIDGRLRKFPFSVGDEIPLNFTVGEKDDWELSDIKHMSKALVNTAVSTKVEIPITKPKDIINSDICNLENYKLIGVAKLIKDDITGLRLWATFNNEGGEHINLSPSQPLIIPAEGKLQLGTKIGFYAPKD